MRHFYSILLLVFLLSSCANYKLNYSNQVKDWEKEHIPPTDQSIKHTMYLIGDLGKLKVGEKAPAVDLLKQKLANAGENSSLIFLGNNVDPPRMSRIETSEVSQTATAKLDFQLDIIKDFKGRPIFIPGHLDWRRTLKGLKRQEKYIEKKLNQGIEDKDDWEDYFVPSKGCGEPEVVELNKQLVVVVVDSEWYLKDWDKEPEINDGCEIKSRKDFAFFFEEIVRKNRNKNVVIAMHHPLFSHGRRGGSFTVKDHLFPFTALNDKLYIPLPVVGSVYPLYRNLIGNKEDLSHKNYKALAKVVLAGATKNGKFIFASGHENNLQYITEDRHHFIVTGSGAVAGPARVSKGSDFAYGHVGFAQLDFYEDGTTWLSYWVPDEANPDGREVYRRKLKGKLEISEENIPESFPEYDKKLSTKVSALTSNKITEKGKWHYFWLGEHYRNLYSKTYEFPVLDLTQFKGGAVPIKRGGGNQTNSLRLEADGQEYVMRSLTKDASRTVPYPFNKMTAADGIVQETFLSSHPFAALAIPPLADAIDVYHTNPKLYYIPKQPVLGVHNDLFGGEVYLVEERAGGNWKNLASFGNSKKLISTGDMAEEIIEDHDHQVDQAWLLRSRLFDQVIGDWDRHDDQWRWARLKINKDSTIYRAIPRDRDQPFSKYDGVLIQTARLFMPFLRQLKVYGPEIKNMKWSSWSPKYIDNSFLNEMTWSDWEREAKFIQENLTDEVIDEAFKAWPDTAQALTAEEIKSIMRKRRDNLVKFARMHYELLYKRTDVYGTEKDERFVIERLDDEHTRVRVYHKRKKGDRLVFDRTFERSVTKELAIYGLGDDDDFIVTGEVNKGILLRLIGGLGKDTFTDESKVSGLGKKTKVYDNLEENEYNLGTEAKNLSSDNRDLNIYDRRHIHYEYDYTIPLPLLGYNPDDGFFLGANLLTTTYRFKKTPYASLHIINGTVAFATGGLDIRYQGDFIDVFGKGDMYIDGVLRSDRFAFNYFGLGNDSELTTDNFDFNRVRQSSVQLYPAFKIPFNKVSSGFTIGPYYEQSEIEATDGRFITGGETGLPDEIFDTRYFGGGKVAFRILNPDNFTMPTRGANFSANFSWLTDLADMKRDFTVMNTSLTMYQNLDKRANFVFATRVGAGHRTGDVPFFHSAILGGNTNFRGYRAERFYGTTSFYHNIDLRLKIFDSVNRILPFSFGVVGSFDHGRVWLEGEDSDTWHTTGGGSVWVAPVDFVVINFGYYLTDEENRFTVRFGFDF